MKKIILGLAAVALTSLLSSCLQNIKDNKLIVENKSVHDIRIDLRAEGKEVAPNTSVTINDIETNKWPMRLTVTANRTNEVIAIANNAADLDFSSRGTTIRVLVTETSVPNVQEKTTVGADSVKITTYDTTWSVQVSANQSSGWTD